MIYIGIDWADKSHVFCILDENGKKLESFSIEHKQDEFDKAHTRIRKWSSNTDQTRIAIETKDSLLVDFFCELGYKLHFINPKQTDRFRDRYRMSSSKSDGFDAFVLANALRTDPEIFTKLDSLDQESLNLRVLTRTREALIGRKVQIHNELIAALKRYFPVALKLLDGVDDPETIAFLLQFPTYPEARSAKRSQIVRLIKKTGASQAIAERHADEIRQKLQEPQPTPAASVERAYPVGVQSLLRQMQSVLLELSELDSMIREEYRDHPNKGLIDSLPGFKEKMGPVLAGELGADLSRFASLRQLKSYAGTCPVTKQSGNYRHVHIRWACNSHLRRTFHLASQGVLNRCLWARNLYDRLRSEGKSHARALRAIADQLIEMLYIILTKRTPYDEAYHLKMRVLHGPKDNTIFVKILT